MWTHKMGDTGYHVTENKAKTYAGANRERYLARQYPDRHGHYPEEQDWGVWDVLESCWVYVI